MSLRTRKGAAAATGASGTDASGQFEVAASVTQTASIALLPPEILFQIVDQACRHDQYDAPESTRNLEVRISGTCA